MALVIISTKVKASAKSKEPAIQALIEDVELAASFDRPDNLDEFATRYGKQFTYNILRKHYESEARKWLKQQLIVQHTTRPYKTGSDGVAADSAPFDQNALQLAASDFTIKPLDKPIPDEQLCAVEQLSKQYVNCAAYEKKAIRAQLIAEMQKLIDAENTNTSAPSKNTEVSK